ncbi:MAG: alpha-1,2-fucosyltransferase [Bacteroidota bacterium]|nr:alpha-1,2-fucosyltransferase [Bacteroidota bacterium]
MRKRRLSASTRFIFSKKSTNIHNGYELDKVFGIKYRDTFANKILYLIYCMLEYKKFRVISKPVIRLLNLAGVTVINENNNYNFQPGILQPRKGLTFYAGGWHSEKYFREVRDEVLHCFQFDLSQVGATNLEILKDIRSRSSVSVHVRRGDFLDSNNYQKYGAVCTLNYFVCAIGKMKELVDAPHFFFFTNDYPWVRENFTGEDVTIVNINAGADSWKDMFLISNCQHHIDSNGSFSWWSSYLNKDERKRVIVPKNFVNNEYFGDIYPENWIQLSDY